MKIPNPIKDVNKWSPSKVTVKLPFQLKQWPAFFKKLWTDGKQKAQKLLG